MLVDHVIMTFVIMTFVVPGVVYDLIQTFGDNGTPPKLFLGNYYLNIFAFSLYFNKDIYLGRSPAKRILKFQVVDNKTNRPANPLRCLLRNITVVLWPIEVIAGLINNERRLGDFIAGTRLTTYDPEFHKSQPGWSLIIVALMAAMVVTYFTMVYPVELLAESTGLIMEAGE